MKHLFITSIALLSIIYAQSQQLDVTADLRMRYEYRHGYSILFNDTLKAANFITQRSRINIDYSNQRIKLRISPQNVRVWGDVATSSRTDLGLQFHEAWADLTINNNLSIKAGRQELNYDDSRILGNVDWLMQARSHDALITKIKTDSSNVFHIGLAVNANRETNSRENYAIPTQYKYLQYLWYHGSFGKSGISFLLFNQGIPYLVNGIEKIAYNQTIGPRYTFANTRLNADAAVYLQSGKIAANKLSALYFSGNINYKSIKGFVTGLGFEYLSGKAGNNTTTKVKSFNPWYGTNHKFNGFMDYFYVGNHINSTGLTDVYANFGYENQKLKLKLTPHYFASAAGVYQTGVKQDSYLGTEIDFTLTYNVVENVQLFFGYSQMFASTSLEVLRGGDKDKTNNWAFLSLHFNPKIFTSKTK
ncbi:MAG TPA: alginate export family protein [Chitinophagaceae bacterium]|nr:alginate export family protein [Chitinophagaceae bacterium]